jgi:hypothetical protein
MKHHCFAVVIKRPEKESLWQWFYSVKQVADYISTLPLAWDISVEIFCDTQEEEKITKI